MKDTEFRVLCVDDEAALRGLLEKGFREHGFSIETAGSAAEALGLLDAGVFDAMVTDIMLPGMNGVELCQKVRPEKNSMFIVAITGYATKYEFSDCIRAGFDAYFTKPLDMKRLCETVREGIQRKMDIDKVGG